MHSTEDWLADAFKQAEEALNALPSWALPVVTRTSIAQRIEHLTTDQKVAGSNPVGGTCSKK
jgi:hypothetical protein